MKLRNYGYAGASVVAIFEDDAGEVALSATLDARQATLLLNGTAEWFVKDSDFASLIYSAKSGKEGTVILEGGEWHPSALTYATVPE